MGEINYPTVNDILYTPQILGEIDVYGNVQIIFYTIVHALNIIIVQTASES